MHTRVRGRRALTVAVAALFLLIVAGSAPAMAASGNQPVGDRISLFSGDQSHAASTAFHVHHGFCFASGAPDTAIGRSRFDLDVDGTRQPATFMKTYRLDGCLPGKEWYFNFAGGMTGSHILTGHWFGPCDNDFAPCNGAPVNTAVEVLRVSITVTFS